MSFEEQPVATEKYQMYENLSSNKIFTVNGISEE